MNGNEKIAYKNTKYAFNWIVGGYYNVVQDDIGAEYLPKSLEALKNEIYEAALTNRYGEGYEGFGKAPKEMRFSGEKFIRDVIDKLCEEDGDIYEIADYANW